MQSELDACRNSREEELCKELGKELEELQRECYHKQMKLQTARQSTKTAPAGNRKGLSGYTHRQPEPNSYSETFTESVHANLVDDEWFEAGLLDDFDSNDEGEIELDEYDWDIDEAELEQDMTLDSQPNSDRTAASKSIPCRNGTNTLPVTSTPGEKQTEKSHSRFHKPARSSSVSKEFNNLGYHLASPCSSSVPRKRPGESIFKAPKATNQTSR